MNVIAKFNYSKLDTRTSEFLQRKESNMREIVSKAYTDLGRELYEAQQELAGNNQYDGMFLRWLEYMNYPQRTAYELIDRYVERLRIPQEQVPIFEAMPISLSKAISAKSSESTSAKAQAKSEVLDGKIDTLKAYRERIAELESQAKQATEKAEQADSARQIAEEKAQQFEQLFGDQSIYDANVTRVTNGDAITYAVYSFQEDTRSLIEKYAHLTHFGREFDGMIDEGRVEYLKAIDSAMDFLNRMKRMLTQQDALIIEQ